MRKYQIPTDDFLNDLEISQLEYINEKSKKMLDAIKRKPKVAVLSVFGYGAFEESWHFADEEGYKAAFEHLLEVIKKDAADEIKQKGYSYYIKYHWIYPDELKDYDLEYREA